MRKLILMALLGLATSLYASEQMYRWVDDEGVTHYSDRPRPGAERIEIRPAQTFTAPVVAERPKSQDAGQAETAVYQTLEIRTPAQEETIWNTGGVVDVLVDLEPRLEAGHSIHVTLDGQTRTDSRSTSHRLTDIPRGAHSVMAEVRDRSGETLISSAPVTFFYQQTSIQNQSNPLAPRPPVAVPLSGGGP